MLLLIKFKRKKMQKKLHITSMVFDVYKGHMLYYLNLYAYVDTLVVVLVALFV